ncbi:MAG: hypothetical protein C0417_11080 [Chlorobiaceae bacterium]|nr:hypothetical protein [Chlorobiaceae bacterium]
MFDLKFDPVIYVSLGAILGIAGLKLFEFLFSLYRDNRQEYRTSYAKFAESFSSFLQQLEMGPATLNLLIVEDFPKHDLARRDFERYLSRRTKGRFYRKWLEYEEKYYQVKQLGIMGMAVALAPPGFDLRTSRPTPEDMIQWEFDRKKELRGIIHELLEIVEP